MKKKIVYISGAEIFDVSDVRSALDEVRELLKIDRDTILFGVPVDAESVEINQTDSAKEEQMCGDIEIPNTDFDDVVLENSPEMTQSEQLSSINESKITIAEEETAEATPVVPILSVLASKTTESGDKQDIIEDVSDDVFESETNDEIESETDEVDVSENSVVSGLDEDIPESKVEKTLEELLETMAPLREDAHPEIKDSLNTVPSIDETDITLENLADEFAQNEDEIQVKKKSTERGKIGKLKNILPFTKKKRDDSGLMGDLFGWAGIAANDEDFSMPGFFANARK